MTPFHHACNLKPEEIAKRSNDFSQMKKHEKDQAIEDAKNLKVGMMFIAFN